MPSAQLKRLNSPWQRHNRSLRAWNQNVHRWSTWLIPRLMKKRPYIFVSAQPKSGSTLLNNLLIRLTGHYPHPLCDAHEQEQNLVLTRLVDSWGFRSIATHHTRATENNVALLRRFDVRPVILVRNIFDVTVSLREHLAAGHAAGFTFNAPAEFATWETDRQLDALIDFALPWYLNFVAGWRNAPLETHLIGYEELTGDPEACLQGILDFHRIDTPKIPVGQVWDLANGDPANRFNIGKTGRGEAVLTKAQKQRIRDWTAYFPPADFSLVGL